MTSTAEQGTREPRLSVSPDGSLIAQVQADHIALVDAESLTVSGEIGIDPEADGCDVILCGDPLRLVVVARYETNGRLHVIDPRGPSAVGELPLRAPLRLAAAAGDHVWLVGGGGSMLVDVVHRDLVVSPLALRAPVAAVGSFAGGRFVVSTGGLIEEWNPEHRAPARRFRLTRPVAAQFVGGGARHVWMVSADGDRLEVIPLINVGQPTRVELPEPPARIAADASHESLVMLGARTGDAYLIDLTGKTPPTAIEGCSGVDVAWLGATANVAVVSAAGDLEVVPASGRPRAALPERPPMAPRPPSERRAAAAPATSSVATPSPAASRAAAPVPAATGSSPAISLTSRGPTILSGGGAAAADAGADSISDRLTAWREKIRTTAPKAPAPATGWVTPPAPPSWRDQLAAWAQSVLSGSRGDLPTLHEGPAVVIAERLGLTGELAAALWLIYGAHLAGVDGVSALDLTRVLGRRWDEALGQGRLAASGALRWRRSRVRLCAETAAALDEGPARTGTWVDSEAEVPRHAVAVVADDDIELAAIARWIAPQLGPLLVARKGGAGKRRHLLEAKLRGGLAVVRWPPVEPAADAGDEEPETTAPPPSLLVVPDDEAARTAGAPLVGTYPDRR